LLEEEMIMTRNELIERIAKDAGISKKSAAVALGALTGAIRDSLKQKEGRIRVRDLGTFKVVHRKARAGVDPRTRQPIQIPAGRVAKFVPSQALKGSVRGDGTGPVDKCGSVEGSVRRLLCRVCGLPVLGELPFCKEHAIP
jgi:DNA-binding protein HU-beta